MIEWYDISEEEFDREWADARERVFERGLARVGWGDYPFADPSWRVIPIPFFPTSRDEPGEDSRDEFPPVEPYFFNYYEPFCRTLKDRNVQATMLTTRFLGGVLGNDGRYRGAEADGGQEKFHAIVWPKVEAFVEADHGRISSSMFCVFDQTAEWGLLCDSFELDCSFLGGSAPFTEAFLRHAGGDENVRAWFTYFILDGGCPLGPEDPETHPDDPGRKILERIYRMAGWEFPRKWNAFAEEAIDWPWVLGWTDDKA